MTKGCISSSKYLMDLGTYKFSCRKIGLIIWLLKIPANINFFVKLCLAFYENVLRELTSLQYRVIIKQL